MEFDVGVSAPTDLQINIFECITGQNTKACSTTNENFLGKLMQVLVVKYLPLFKLKSQKRLCLLNIVVISTEAVHDCVTSSARQMTDSTITSCIYMIFTLFQQYHTTASHFILPPLPFNMLYFTNSM